jgi:hypothetical protein
MSDAEYLELESTDAAETPTMAELFRIHGKNIANLINVAKPAKVLAYDFQKQIVTVQPAFKIRYLDGTIVDPPVIYGVPVLHPRAGKAVIHMPIKEGDNVFLLFSDRSIEKWATSGQLNYPEDTRTHHISDAFAFPGGYPLGAPSAIANGDDLIISNALGDGGCEIRVKPNGHIQILNQGEELITVLENFMQATIYRNLGGMWDALDRIRKFLES